MTLIFMLRAAHRRPIGDGQRAIVLGAVWHVARVFQNFVATLPDSHLHYADSSQPPRGRTPARVAFPASRCHRRPVAGKHCGLPSTCEE
jgi:hypothetical protein